MKTLFTGFLVLASMSAFASTVNLPEGEYFGNYKTNVKRLCLVSVSAPYGDKTVSIHSSNDVFSEYFELELKYFKKVEKGSYRGEDPDLGELLTYSFKINEKKELTEASVINAAIRSNTIECENLKLEK